MAESCYPVGLMPVDEAIERLVSLAREKSLETETLALASAAGRVLAEDAVAPMDVPPEANSAMDGVAFCHADLPVSGVLRISQRIPAGKAPASLEQGTAARIFTGGVLPAGADTVVMQEDCEFHGDEVRLLTVPPPGANVRPAGQDVACGSIALQKGQRLDAPALGLLASMGVDAPRVFRRLRVAVLATGDELLEPDEPWRPGAIYNSNRPMLANLLTGWGSDVIDLGKVPDSREGTEAAFGRALEQKADVIISTGGVSVGEEDHVKAALQASGRLDFWKIAIKPGKPVAVGEIGQARFIGLPGNPQSVFVTALLLARPFLLAMQGQQQVRPRHFAVAAGFARKTAGNRREYLRVQIQDDGHGPCLCPHAQQSSGALMSAAWADGLALIEAGARVEPGQPLPFLPFSTLYLP